MDLLGDILSSMDKNKRPGLSSADKMIQKQNEAIKKTVEKEKAMINNFKVKTQHKVADFIKNDKVSTMQYDPMEKVFRNIIIEVVDEAGHGLCAHTFGREDRYVVVYKNPPSELELEARRYYDYKQWNKEIETEFKKRKAEEHAIQEASTSVSEQNETKPNKKQKLIHVECEAIKSETRNFGMVSSELKKDKRTVEEALNDIQLKKRLKSLQNDQDNSQE